MRRDRFPGEPLALYGRRGGGDTVQWEQAFRRDREQADEVLARAAGRGAEEERGPERVRVEEGEINGGDEITGAQAGGQVGEVERPLPGVPEREVGRVRWW